VRNVQFDGNIIGVVYESCCSICRKTILWREHGEMRPPL
jgi:hypothetical protein